MYITIEQIIEFIIEATKIESATDILNRCRKLFMKEVEYIDFGSDFLLPEFDKGFNFISLTENQEEVKLEIFVRGNEIVQASIYIRYSESWPDIRRQKHFKTLRNNFSKNFGRGVFKRLSFNSKDVSYINLGNIVVLTKKNYHGFKLLTIVYSKIKFWEN